MLCCIPAPVSRKTAPPLLQVFKSTQPLVRSIETHHRVSYFTENLEAVSHSRELSLLIAKSGFSNNLLKCIQIEYFASLVLLKISEKLLISMRWDYFLSSWIITTWTTITTRQKEIISKGVAKIVCFIRFEFFSYFSAYVICGPPFLLPTSSESQQVCCTRLLKHLWTNMYMSPLFVSRLYLPGIPFKCYRINFVSLSHTYPRFKKKP